MSRASSRIFLFGLMMFFVFFADSMMSYISPIFIADKMNSAFVMGLILSSSSVVGLLADMVISQQFARQEYRFFARWLLALAMFFPLSLLFMPAQPITFLIAMAIWGIYFEFISFSQFNFVHSVVSTQQHTSTWGILETFKAFGCVIAPIAATFLLQRSPETAMYVVVLSLVAGMVLFFCYKKAFGNEKIESQPSLAKRRKSIRTLWQELALWKALFTKVWPMYLFFFSFILMESAFWTIGPLLSEEIRHLHPYSGFLLTAYVLPSLFMPLMAKHLSARFSKKRIAFWAALIGSLILGSGALFIGHSPWLMVLVFISSLFFSIDYPEIQAEFEDYISRIEGYNNDLIGLQSTATSLSYIIGPALAGLLASIVGSSATLGIFGLFLAAVSAILLVVTPRKIRMPQQELREIAPAAS